MKVMITGNRPFKLKRIPAMDAHHDLFYYLQDLKVKYKDDLTILTGMALGPDQWIADMCIKLGIRFVAYLPFNGQESKWSSTEQNKYHTMLSKASNTIIESQSPYNSAYLRRNDRMVKECDMAVCVFNGDEKSGTGYTIRKLKQANKPFHNLYSSN